MNEDIQYKERKELVKNIIYSPEYKPLKYKELCYLLQLKEEDKSILSKILNELLEECLIMKTPRGKYQKLESGYKTGTFLGTLHGYGFVTVEGEPEDYFIPEKACHGALHQDTVLMQVTDVRTGGGRRKEGEIVKILSRGITELVGTFDPGRQFGFVIPDNVKYNSDIYVTKAHSMGAVRGHKVVVRITDFGGKDRKPEGRITEILGHINDPGTDVLSIVKAYELPEQFNDIVLRQAERMPDTVSSQDMAGRKDLRGLQTVTIDGEDAKDLDDAITIAKTEQGYELGVHIADVSQYVTEHTPLDEEALRRGTSIYLVDRVIPMLPHKLSNGICSLNQGEDRLALSCIMQMDEKGTVISHEIAETVIRVDRRMTYTAVNKIIEDDDITTKKEYEEFVPMFLLMKELSDLLREKRKKRGSIDFDFPETKITLDEKGFPVEIKPYERLAAHKLIEDFMLIANETVAEDYFWQELPFVYRTHETPDSEKLQALSVMISNFGYYFKTGSGPIHPKEFQKLLGKIEGLPEEALISRLVLRSMKQARYTTSCIGHFGLSAKYYCHFTSPIRRYPDLQIHRIIKENLHGGLSEKRAAHYHKILDGVADSSSKLERRAEEAEREVEKLKKVEYMHKHIGDCYEGVISGVNAWGMFVELENTVEGLVHVTTMIDDYYFYDEEKYAMIGRDTHKEYRLGQKVTVRVKDTDRLMKTIDFVLAEEE